MISNTSSRSWKKVRALAAAWNPRVLELGTCRSIENRPTHSKLLFPTAKVYVMADFQAGLDVDVVVDAHQLSGTFYGKEFDVVVANSVFEHLTRPWVVADEIHKVLETGGLCFVQTHQSFPLHGYPKDYWRFTLEAMKEVVFPEDKWEFVDGEYEFPAEIVSQENPEGRDHQAFLNVNVLFRSKP